MQAIQMFDGQAKEQKSWLIDGLFINGDPLT
jgi:hypothetical protein